MDSSVLGFGGAIVLGAGSSLHCMLMCGPLGCAASGVEPEGRKGRIAAYQLGRIVAYTLLGGVLGVFGSAVSRMVRIDLRAAVPWLLVVALLLSVAPAGLKRLPQGLRVTQFLRRLGAPLRALPPLPRALLLGGLTPLLPCGLLYSIFPAIIATQSAPGGALLLGAFALGSAPSLLLAQAPLSILPRRPLDSWRVVVPLLAAAVLLYRTIQTTSGHTCH